MLAGWLALEWIDGRTVRRCLNERLAGAPVADDDLAGEGDAIGKGADETAGGDAALRSLMRRVGAAVGALHAAGVVHGDLTTSNLMLRRPSPPPPPQPPAAGEPTPNPSLAAATAEGGDDNDDGLGGSVVLVDFGLAAQSAQDEDRAVDLYVLERAFASTHPAAAGELFRGEVLRAYAAAFPGGKAVLRRLDEVRMRGRKRSMLG
jgi:TP53 regulating kinase-like protein